MSSIDSEILKFQCGLPITYKDICLIYSPFLKEIAAEGLDKFYTYLSVLVSPEKPKNLDNNPELKALLSPLTDFEYLILSTSMDKEVHKTISAAIYFFTKDKATFVTKPTPMIVLGDVEERRYLTQETFSGFQDKISLACAMLDPHEDLIEFLDSDTPQVRALKEQLRDGRKKRAKAKQKSDGENKLQLTDFIASVAIGTNSLNMINIWDLTYYAFQDQLKRMSWYEEFDINMRASMAGAKMDKKKLSHWIKSMTFN